MNDHNEFSLNGKRYIAVVEDPDHACRGCVFDDKASIECPFDLSCRCGIRKDGRSIIWIEASEVKEGEKRK